MSLNEIINMLSEAGIADASSEACILASHFTGKSTALLLCDRSSPLQAASDALEALADAVRRRITREPLQYIIGRWDFMGLPFEVSPDCLIPRSDTELLCETAIKSLPKNGRFLDLCTGSGCIAAAVAHYRPDARVSALEKYPQTIKMAKKNCEAILGGRNNVRFIEADVTSHLSAFGNFGGERFDFIAANPPYVSYSEMKELEPELSSEPRHALTDEEDGLSFIREIINIYPVFLEDGGFLAVEHGSAQGEAVRRLFSEAGHMSKTLRDLNGHERVTLMQNCEYH